MYVVFRTALHPEGWKKLIPKGTRCVFSCVGWSVTPWDLKRSNMYSVLNATHGCGVQKRYTRLRVSCCFSSRVVGLAGSSTSKNGVFISLLENSRPPNISLVNF